jgi:hypothetical protein
VEAYDPATDTWTRKANMPTGLWGLCANVVNEKIYVFGGRPAVVAVSVVYEYDPATDTWMRKADMPVRTSQMASVVLGDNIVVIGGWLTSGNPPYKTVQIYDPEADTWTKEADTPFLRATCSASVVNNKIYVIGGTDRPHPCPALSTVYELGPLLDFNADGIVDAEDMCSMVDHWGEDYPLCDIGPTLFGDKIVDVQDLTVLSEHLFEEVTDPTLIAHWAFDEAEGEIAYEKIQGNDGNLHGEPVWQPAGGKVSGALMFDGIDDYVSTPFIITPIAGDFSIFAWIKSGAAGQVILSQANGANWLCADSVEGYLMTELKKDSGRFKGDPLSSEALINDGNWHRISFVWDGSYRHLYVDGVEVASDAEPLSGLNDAYGGLYIGTGSSSAVGTFWSGLIDDIRIYNRAVHP